ncbi:methyltransferase domain-containing protein [Streptomyces violaceusniger]
MTSAAEQAGRPTREELGRLLLDTGAMSAEWAPAYEAVPRSRFLPALIWPHDMATGQYSTVSEERDPEAWQRYADSDDPIVTQWDDGAHEGPEPGKSFSSSSSMPSLVFAMLADLDVKPGQRVLEIGTGTGWNAALLAYRLGAENIVTVEVDGAVASDARESLDHFGLPVRVVHGDGLLGYAARAPYDRVIATCGLRKIPFAWVEQSKPGGVLLVPWGTYYGPGEATARLVVARHGLSASGPFTRPVAFMRLRSQRFVWPRHDEYVPPGALDAADTSTTTLTEAQLCGTGSFDAVGFALGLRVPDVAHNPDRKRDGRRAVWFYGTRGSSDRSWAVAVFRDDRKEAKVYQSGPRRLWDEVESAYHWWVGYGEPAHSRFGLTVTAEETHAWLDDSANSWPL